ncbi:hypothetical protein KXW98_001323 [Aspergillus fumigatus]|nr:hypothetical protein CNMCM8057_001478 [Aspergillus fumigatus]KAF4282779.1 hypothetical protein CNMCM8689_007872 [Aspergillus fumigatus]KAF4291816.1 hypothetical protein CNMCM8686_008242 [Aspergillus fumigatus]KAH1320334.1 hypothetical protein KXX47_001733 [Aspergillus fumigatus]KAH1322503.1 hypothetical protein KXX38_008253 [Aspergillus fumigatus]
MVEVVGPLSARPPTPPRTGSRILSEKDRTEDSPIVVQTPVDSPFAADSSVRAPSTRQSKRVNFSPWTKYIKPPSFTNSAPRLKSELKELPPSNECKPTKSILKTTNAHPPIDTTDAAPCTPESFAMLLDSITQQLAGESISSRLDAYMQFFGALRAYEGLPSEQELGQKLGLISQFIQRDLSTDLGDDVPLGTNLVIQALKLAAALSWNIEIAAHLPDEFKVFLVEHSINALESAKAPKSVLTHYMSILSTQNFHSKIMTNARIIRLLTVLGDITSRVNGNAIVFQRLSIYQRLLTQSKSIFVSHSGLWVEHLLSGLLHHVKDTRIKAISLGFQTSMICGPNPSLSKSIRDLFDRPLDNGRKLVSEICERMSRMMANVESGVHVPQVWSIIVLLLRSKRLSIDQWEHFKEWVLVLQRCFNCSESSIKAQAILGWNRFVYVVSPSDTTSRSMLRMLSKPIMSQFERKKQERHGSQPGQLALCSYHNLLYYAFRPSATLQHLDIVWEEYVAGPSNVFASFPHLNDRFCHALSNLLWSPQAKIWTENKVNESTKLEPEELPSIDCKWVRSRITIILNVFEAIFRTSLWADDLDKSNIAAAWISLSQALSYASSKEITPSKESMQAVASVLGHLQRLWNAGPSSLNALGDESMDVFFDRFRFLSTTMISSLGGIPFTEKLLLKTANETFQAANTPTHHPVRANTNLDSPILHLLRFISDVTGVPEPTPSYSRLVDGTLEAACKGRISRGSRLELLQQCARLYPNDADFDFGVQNFAQIVWNSTAQLAAESLRSFPLESARERDGSVIRDYENVVKILSAGLKFSTVFPAWNQLLDALVRVMRTEKGDRAIALMTLEPLAECMMTIDARNTYLPLSSLFTQSLSIPYCHQSDSGTKEGEVISRGPKEDVFFPNRLVQLVDRTLQESYSTFDPSKTSGVADFIESLTSFLGSGILAFRRKLLENFQGSLALWLRDEARKLNIESGVESRILTACRALSSAVINILQSSSPHDALCLHRFEIMIGAGLESSHTSIAKRFLEFWNSTFGSQETLEYPEVISRALAKLHQLQSLHRAGNTQGDVRTKSVSPEGSREAVDMSIKSRISYILDDTFEHSRSPSFHSSPVTDEREVTALPLSRNPDVIRRQPAPPFKDRHVESTVKIESDPFITDSKDCSKPNDVFSIIDSIRSSSPPVQTPRELGFMTPPHARQLSNPAMSTHSPRTPTFPAVAIENEDGFFGSSPTPGTRGRAQVVGSTIPSTLTTEAMDPCMNFDPPSSPPGIRSLSPNSRNIATPSNIPQMPSDAEKENIRAVLTQEKTTVNDVTSEYTGLGKEEHCETGQSERPLKRRLRSSMGKQQITNAPAVLEPETPVARQETESVPEPLNNDKGGFLESVHVVESAPKMDQGMMKGNVNQEEMHTDPDCIADSFSDDMETQVASQLEQDLESAGNMNEEPKSKAPSEPPKQQTTRKRKRGVKEADAGETSSTRERRRSSRLSSTKTPSAVEVQESMSTRASRSMTTPSSQNLKSSPAESVAKRRKCQFKGEEGASTAVISEALEPAKEQDTSQEHIASSHDRVEVSGNTEISPQKRRSSRLGGHPAPAIADEGPSRRQSSRTARSRKQAKNKELLSESFSLKKLEADAPDSVMETPAAEIPNQNLTCIRELTLETSVHGSNLPKTITPDASVQPSNSSSGDTEMVEAEPAAEPEPTDDHAQVNAAQTDADGNNHAPEDKIMISHSAQTGTLVGQEGVISSLRRVLDDVKSTTLNLSALKEIDDLLFDIRVEMHEALRRHAG